MKYAIRRILREEYNNHKDITSMGSSDKLILNELSNRTISLLSFIRRKYEIMDNSFTPRLGSGEKWYSKDDIVNELINTFNLNKDFAEEIVDYYVANNFI